MIVVVVGSIVQKEAGVDEKEELKLSTVVYHSELPEDPLSQCDTPGKFSLRFSKSDRRKCALCIKMVE